MRTIRDIPRFQNVPILVRAALNVPIEKGEVANDYRLRRALPTITYLAERGARVVLMSHIGEAGTETLAPVARALAKLLPNVTFFNETVGPRAREAVRNLLPGHILILENLRRNRGEVTNDPAFAKELAALADAFVEDSFDTCHRLHASIVGVPHLLPSYAGLLVEEEVRELTRALAPKKPSLAVIGGAKFSTKEAVLNRLLALYDHVFVGGALANDFLKSAKYEIGKSLVSNTAGGDIHSILVNKKLILPVDVRVISSEKLGQPDARISARVRSIDQVLPDEIILDAGPRTEKYLEILAGNAKDILWNGPLGQCEDGFVDATDDLARAVSTSGARSTLGGGDTVAAIENIGLLPHFSFVSTGGGAMLDFLAAGTLPGLVALN